MLATRFSFLGLVSWIRSIHEWLRTGELSAHLRVIMPQDSVNFLYGPSWMVAFYRGGPVDLRIFVENGLGLAVLVGLVLASAYV